MILNLNNAIITGTLSVVLDFLEQCKARGICNLNKPRIIILKGEEVIHETVARGILGKPQTDQHA